MVFVEATSPDYKISLWLEGPIKVRPQPRFCQYLQIALCLHYVTDM